MKDVTDELISNPVIARLLLSMKPFTPIDEESREPLKGMMDLLNGLEMSEIDTIFITVLSKNKDYTKENDEAEIGQSTLAIGTTMDLKLMLTNAMTDMVNVREKKEKEPEENDGLIL